MKRLLIIITILLSLNIINSTYSTMFAPNKASYVGSEKYNTELFSQVEHFKYKQEFNRFLKDLGFYESSNDWKKYNTLGYIGEWQFGKAALEDVGYKHITFRNFKKDPTIFPKSAQKRAVTILIDLNIKRLGKLIEQYEGKTIKGVKITTSGLIAASHLAGTDGVKLFLATNGKYNPKDVYNTSLLKYLKVFEGYNI